MRSGPFVRRSADATNDGRRHARRGRLSRLLWAVALAASGCKSHHAERYAFAPPYAPPVYPQPQPQPVAYGTPAGTLPPGALPPGALPPGAVVSGAPVPAAPQGGMTAEGFVVPAGSPCPPCEAAAGGMVSGQPVFVEGGGQTPPCPPGP